MSKTGKRLELIKQVFARREQVVARKMSAFQQDLKQAEAQLGQLRAHRERHTASVREEAGSTDPGRLQNRQAFQQRLNEAISQQEQLIQRARIESAELRAQWLAKRRKTLSVEKLNDRRQRAEQQRELSQEQARQDELSRGGFRLGGETPD